MTDFKKMAFGVGALTMVGSAAVQNVAAQSERLNVLFIAIDDLKPDISPYGDPVAITPAFDRLAAQGVTYMNNYCQFPLSGPTRASVLTGLRPDHTGVWTLAGAFRRNNPDIVSLPQLFARNGYQTVGIGKVYHPLADKKYNNDPVSWTKPYNKPVAPTYVLSNARPVSECVDVPDNAYVDGRVADEAVAELARLKKEDKPFFLAVGFIRPHLPFVAPKKYWDLYDREQMPLAQMQGMSENPVLCAYHNSNEVKAYTDMPSFHSYVEGQQLDPEIQRKLVHGYYACASYVDAQLGRVLDALEEQGLTDNTVVVVWGDHGYHLGDHGLWSKLTNFEAPTRTLLMIAAPGNAAGRKCRSITEFVDIYPTLCELAGVEAPSVIDGVSLVPTLRNPKARVKDFAVMQANRQQIQGYSIRDDRYRYVEWVRGFKTCLPFDAEQIVGCEFYDYSTDPLEKTNAIADPKYKRQVEKMRAQLRKFYDGQYASPMSAPIAAMIREGRTE